MVHFLRVFQRARNASLDEILQKRSFRKILRYFETEIAMIVLAISTSEKYILEKYRTS